MTDGLAQPVKYLEAVDNALNAAGVVPKIVNVVAARQPQAMAPGAP